MAWTYGCAGNVDSVRCVVGLLLVLRGDVVAGLVVDGADADVGRVARVLNDGGLLGQRLTSVAWCVVSADALGCRKWKAMRCEPKISAFSRIWDTADAPWASFFKNFSEAPGLSLTLDILIKSLKGDGGEGRKKFARWLW